MPRKEPYAKIAITLPQDDLAAANRLAATQDRSRSWIIAEAVRQYVAQAAAPALDPSRAEQLRRDLTLTPLQRVAAGEEALRVIPDGGAQEPRTFPSYDAFQAWLRTRDRAT
ncbi:MAG: CopG family transcriptional regulator [Gemmatimonadaceae bacterium]|nr:CopG family transcriptional regulator [Gemmatimonadaceae bacterium]